MGFNFAEAKAMARRVVQDTLAVAAFYQDASMSEAAEIRARWFNKLVQRGDLDNGGYAQLVDSVDQIVLFPDDTPGLTFVAGGTVEFPHIGKTFRLSVKEPTDGELQVIWQVTEA